MTIATPAAGAGGLDPLATDLPIVERRAVLPSGFLAAGGVAGIKASGRPDLALIATVTGPDGSRRPAAAAAVFTPNRFAAAPVRLSQRTRYSPPNRSQSGSSSLTSFARPGAGAAFRSKILCMMELKMLISTLRKSSSPAFSFGPS